MVVPMGLSRELLQPADGEESLGRVVALQRADQVGNSRLILRGAGAADRPKASRRVFFLEADGVIRIGATTQRSGRPGSGTKSERSKAASK